MRKKLGVIGGLGTDTAAEFYIECEKLWEASKQTGHVPFMLENCETPYTVVQSIITETKRIDELIKPLCDAAINLEKGGATVLAIPCNTAHAQIKKVRAAVNIPVISITDEVAKYLAKTGVHTAAILGTAVTKIFKIYDESCSSFQIKTVYPSTQDQIEMESIICRVLSWENDKADQFRLEGIIDRVLKDDADVVVLACTDLQLVLPKPLQPKVVDSMNVLSEACINYLLS